MELSFVIEIYLNPFRQETVFSNDRPIFKRIQFRNGIERYFFTDEIENILNSDHGIEIYPDVANEKLYYRGNFKTDSSNGFESIIKEPHGMGSLTYKNFTRYDGTFKDGNIDGVGTFLHYDAANKNYKIVYEGQVKNGERNGIGDLSYSVLTNSENIVRYEGQFVNNTPHGVGKMTFKDGSTFQGGFLVGQISGFGKLTYSKKQMKGKNNIKGNLTTLENRMGLGKLNLLTVQYTREPLKMGLFLDLEHSLFHKMMRESFTKEK